MLKKCELLEFCAHMVHCIQKVALPNFFLGSHSTNFVMEFLFFSPILETSGLVKVSFLGVKIDFEQMELQNKTEFKNHKYFFQQGHEDSACQVSSPYLELLVR